MNNIIIKRNNYLTIAITAMLSEAKVTKIYCLTNDFY